MVFKKLNPHCLVIFNLSVDKSLSLNQSCLTSIDIRSVVKMTLGQNIFKAKTLNVFNFTECFTFYWLECVYIF